MKSNSAPTPPGGVGAAEAPVDLPLEATTALADAYSLYAEATKKRSSPDRKAAATHLANLAATGRAAGWSVRALAEPCGITPERLRQIIKAWSDGTPVDIEFPPHPSPRFASPRQRNARMHLTEDEARELRRLAPKAASNSGSCELDTAPRQASERFSYLIKEHHDRGVTWQELSDATRPWKTWPLDEKAQKTIRRFQERKEQAKEKAKRGEEVKPLGPEPFKPTHHPSGLRMRAARHGYGAGAPPSVKPYRGVFIHAKSENTEGGQEAVKKAS